MKCLWLYFLLFFFCWLQGQTSLAQSQQDSTLYRLETTDGNEYIGLLVSQTADTVSLKTEKLGLLQFARSDIRSMEAVKPGRLKAGKYWFDNPQATRYLFAPTGYGLKKGEGYYQNIWVLLNQASVGLSNHVSVGFGTVPLFLFFRGTSTPIWVVPKVSIPIKKDKLNLGLGAAMGTILHTGRDHFDDPGNSHFGILFGVATFGSKDRNLTTGLGYGYTGEGLARAPAITISSLIRIGPRGYFITENYLFPLADGTAGLISVGGRHLVKRTGIDFGLVTLLEPDGDGPYWVPILGLTFPFGRR